MGNRTSQTAPSGQTVYTYDQNNRLTQAGAVVYSYDPNGNLTGTSAGQSFTYDPFNRMTQAVSAGGTATYTYNGDGLKVQRVGPDGATRYYYDGIRPIWETDGAGAMTAQLDRDIFGNLLSRVEPGSRRYYHTDGLGSTVALSDETGATAAFMLYDAWGNVRVSSGSGHGKYRFTGAELDTASDLYHMGARFYDPSIGRWLSEDPVQGGYAYVANNPLVLIDPAGMMEGDSNPCDAACENDIRNANAAAAPSTEAYRAWLGARQMGRTPPRGWENYVGLAMQIGNQLHVPPSLILAVMGAESGYKPKVISDAGAIGFMQVMPETAWKGYGVTADQLFDPETNIRVGTMELKRLLGKYDLIGALASYNEGEGAYLAGHLYKETREYIPRVLDFWEYFRHIVFP